MNKKGQSKGVSPGLDMVKEWRRERDEVILTQDYIKFAAFYEKWRRRGIYDRPLPSRDVVEIAMRKCLLALEDAPVEKNREAREWLTERGYKPHF